MADTETSVTEAAAVGLPASTTKLPRVTIQFCTQCKWMLRAAYYAQELLSTFNLALGEVALQPSTGGTFVVTIYTRVENNEKATAVNGPGSLPSAATMTIDGQGKDGTVGLAAVTLWDRKVDGGFPETKELKRRLRDVIEPGRDLGHVDRHDKKKERTTNSKQEDDHEPPGTNAGGVVSGGQNSEGRTNPKRLAGDVCEDCV